MTSAPLSIFYTVTAISLLLGFFMLKKSDKRINSVVWIPITIISFFCYNNIITGIINLVKIPVNLLSLGIFNIIFSSIIWFVILSKKKRQKFNFEWLDLIALIVILGVTVFCALQQFGITLQIHYNTSDPAIHMKSANEFINNQAVGSMFFSQITNGLIMSILEPFFEVVWYYKLFILCDILMFFLSGAMFYSLIRKFSNTLFIKVSAIIVTVIYMLGYPRNNMNFGFVYLGLGVTVIAYIIYFTNCFISGDLNKNISILLLMMGCFGIFMCYILFMPVVFFSVFFAITVYYLQIKKLISLEYVFTQLKIFLIPSALGLIYSLFFQFGENGIQITSAINTEGFIYRDLFSNFIIFIPFAFYGIIAHFSIKKISISEFMIFFLAIFMVALLFLGLKGKVSSYYYYKNYYFMSLLVFYFAHLGLSYLSKISKKAIISYASVWAIVAAMALTRFDEKVNRINSWFFPTIKSNCYFDIYLFNQNFIHTNKLYSTDYMNLIKFVIDGKLAKDKEVPIFDDWIKVYWFEAITNQNLTEYYYWLTNANTVISNAKSECQYVVVINNSEFVKQNQDYFNSLEKVYGNSEGFVAKIN